MSLKEKLVRQSRRVRIVVLIDVCLVMLWVVFFMFSLFPWVEGEFRWWYLPQAITLMVVYLVGFWCTLTYLDLDDLVDD